MPEGCSTWPAAWETAVDDWPYKGEVDIVRRFSACSPHTDNLARRHGPKPMLLFTVRVNDTPG